MVFPIYAGNFFFLENISIEINSSSFLFENEKRKDKIIKKAIKIWILAIPTSKDYSNAHIVFVSKSMFVLTIIPFQILLMHTFEFFKCMKVVALSASDRKVSYTNYFLTIWGDKKNLHWKTANTLLEHTLKEKKIISISSPFAV